LTRGGSGAYKQTAMIAQEIFSNKLILKTAKIKEVVKKMVKMAKSPKRCLQELKFQ